MSISELIEHRITEAFPFEVELRNLSSGGVESPHAGFFRNDRDDVTGWLPHAVATHACVGWCGRGGGFTPPAPWPAALR